MKLQIHGLAVKAFLISVIFLANINYASADWWVLGSGGPFGFFFCSIQQTPDGFSPNGHVVHPSLAGDDASQRNDAFGWMCQNHRITVCSHNNNGPCMQIPDQNMCGPQHC